MQCPPTKPGANGKKFHLLRAPQKLRRCPNPPIPHRQFVHQRDIDIALRILNRLCRFGNANGRSGSRAGGNGGAI